MEDRLHKCFTCNVVVKVKPNRRPICPLCGAELQKPEAGPPATHPRPVGVPGPITEHGKQMIEELEKNNVLLKRRKVTIS